MENHHPVVWIFCRVIDNFGDAGIAWRLSQILATEFDCAVTLYIDHLPTLSAIVPDIQASSKEQNVHQVRVKDWDLSIEENSIPQAVIEMFACEIPHHIRTIIQKHQPLWLNWEYLSAEDWVEDCHMMPSLQNNGVVKYFYFMGFTHKTGGLLREKHLSFHLPTLFRQPEKMRLFCFAYDNPIWQHHLQTWNDLSWNVEIFIAGETLYNAFQRFTSFQAAFQQGKIHLQAFVPQADFDDLLQSFDMLIVRGEDSFMRAQYSGKPFFWHIYPQEEQAHLPKLNAFWNRVYHHFPENLKIAHQALSDELNGAICLTDEVRQNHWHTLWTQYPAWHQAHLNWRKKLFELPSAVEKLVFMMTKNS